MPFWIEGAVRTYEALDASFESFSEAFKLRVKELKCQGGNFSEELYSEAWIHLSTAPRFIGVGAEEKNGARINAVRNSYITNEGGRATLHPEVLGWRELST